MAAPLAHPDKENAVVGYLSMRGFAGIPRQARPYPEAFTDTLAAIAYAAAWELDHRGRAVTAASILESIEGRREWLLHAEEEARARQLTDWRNAIICADDSLGHQPDGKAAIECLEKIAAAAKSREGANTGKKLAAGEISIAEALEALGRIQNTGGGLHSWDAELITAEDLCDEKNAEAYKDAPIIIEGMLAQGDLSLITAGSKSFKSWLALQIALCTANGIPFLNRQTAPTKTLVLNFELKPASINNRLGAIAHRLKCGRKNLTILNLRNKPITPAFLDYLTRLIKEQGFGLVIIDPLYALYGVVESENVENSNPAMTELLSTIRAACEQAGAAAIIVHHHAKGDSSTKASIDRASGAGALGRFPDFVMSLVRHESPNAYVVEIDFRDFPPCDPFVIRRENSIMVLDQDLDPATKKTAKPANTKIVPDDVRRFIPTDKAIPRAELAAKIVAALFVHPDTASRRINDALALKICRANKHGIYIPKCESQAHF